MTRGVKIHLSIYPSLAGYLIAPLTEERNPISRDEFESEINYASKKVNMWAFVNSVSESLYQASQDRALEKWTRPDLTGHVVLSSASAAN